MNKIVLNFATAGLLLAAGSCHAAGALSFSSEETVDSSPATVWKYVGDFNGFDLWHPQVRSSTVKGAGNKAGAVRTLKLSTPTQSTSTIVSSPQSTEASRPSASTSSRIAMSSSASIAVMIPSARRTDRTSPAGPWIDSRFPSNVYEMS
jgi:mxaD protein